MSPDQAAVGPRGSRRLRLRLTMVVASLFAIVGAVTVPCG